MDNVSFALNEFMSCLLSIPPLDLKGMELLAQQPHLLGGFAQVPRPQLVEAVTEIVTYTGRCATAARSLANLTPIPLLSVSIREFGI
ncbi:MAG: hypothetical protein J0M33_16420 [Anaerolineae bacterium]|nr:hypothetical protein [Anaerolineae bacterium]